MPNLRPLKDKADQCLGRRQYREAEKLYLELARLEPNDARVHVRLGELARRLGDPKRAAQAYYHAAQLLARGGQESRARGACQIARTLDPSEPEPILTFAGGSEPSRLTTQSGGVIAMGPRVD